MLHDLDIENHKLQTTKVKPIFFLYLMFILKPKSIQRKKLTIWENIFVYKRQKDKLWGLYFIRRTRLPKFISDSDPFSNFSVV